MNTVGQKIRHLRRQNKWGQEQVAGMLGVTVAAVSKIESGITDLNISRLQQIAELFGSSTADLLSDGRNPKIEHTDALDAIGDQLRVKEAEIIVLQRKIIELYDELYPAIGNRT